MVRSLHSAMPLASSNSSVGANAREHQENDAYILADHSSVVLEHSSSCCQSLNVCLATGKSLVF